MCLADQTQPWEMTSLAFYRSPLAKAMVGKPIGGRIYSGSAKPSAAGRRKWFTDQCNRIHELEVRQALQEGKNVPIQALAEYPSLKKILLNLVETKKIRRNENVPR